MSRPKFRVSVKPPVAEATEPDPECSQLEKQIEALRAKQSSKADSGKTPTVFSPKRRRKTSPNSTNGSGSIKDVGRGSGKNVPITLADPGKSMLILRNELLDVYDSMWSLAQRSMLKSAMQKAEIWPRS